MAQGHQNNASKRTTTIVIFALFAVIIGAWVISNVNGPKAGLDKEQAAAEEIRSALADLESADRVLADVKANHLVKGWRMMDSYVIKTQEAVYHSPPNFDKSRIGEYSDLRLLIVSIVEKNESAHKKLSSVNAEILGEKLKGDIDQFGNYVTRLRERLDALNHSIETGDSLPPDLPRPATLESDLEAVLSELSP
ncbi:MAG: hypothetical protein ACWA5Q_10915 [bacterium]